MILKKFTCIIACFLLLQNYLCAQDKSNIKFGKITPADFDLSKYKFDTSASAVIIADIGNTSFAGNTKGWVSYVFKKHTRIKIINKSAFEAATVKIKLYGNDEDQEKVDDIEATSYNIDNGRISETKLDKKDIFTDVLDKHHSEKKFTVPGIKEGSIIEFSYTKKSNFYFNIPTWQFQSTEYPCLWSEYNIEIPNLVSYVFLRQGVHPFFVDEASQGTRNYIIREQANNGSLASHEQTLSVSAITIRHQWAIKDIPALNSDAYIFTSDNYVDKIEFQLSKTYDGESTHDVSNSWAKATTDLLAESIFGKPIQPDNFDESIDLSAIGDNESNNINKAHAIYNFIKNNFTCTNYYHTYITTSLTDVIKKKSGGVGEINLLLIAMLRKKGIHADPVLLSTREFGTNISQYPILDRLNYVICRATIDGNLYYLDATHSFLGFGDLPPDCYNGHARIICESDSASVYFLPDSLKEKKMTTIFIMNDEKIPGSINGTFASVLGNTESYNLRQKVSKKSEEDYFKNIISYNSDYSITNTGIDSLTQLDMPATIHYDFSYKISSDDEIIYFNPMMSEEYKENPFKSAERKYPVEMPYVMDEIYVLNMEIPKGYVVDELPKSARVSLNGSEGSFEYIVGKDDSNIQLRSRIKLNKATFEPEDYSTLRDFFAYIVKKQSEQIVFKKKK